jgi:GT2 family glycosyltransferase
MFTKPQCTQCKKVISIPIKCCHCSLIYCTKHIQPEKHNCAELKNIKPIWKREKGWCKVHGKYHTHKKNINVSVIIATFNGANKICNCLDSIIIQTYPYYKLEILVIDDYSTDNLKEVISNYPSVNYIINDGVHCQPSARNKGIKEAAGDVLLFLDDDTVLEPDYIENIVEDFITNPHIGGVTGRQTNVRVQDIKKGVLGKVMFQYAKFFDTSGFFTNQNDIGKVHKTGFVTSNFNSLKLRYAVEWLSGCNMAYTREAIEKTGLFDTGFHTIAYYDDADYSVRVKKNGFPIVRSITARLEHKASFADNNSVARLKYFQLIHNNRFFLKNVYQGSKKRYFKHLLAHLSLSIPITVYSIIYRNPKLIWSYLKAESIVLTRLIKGV